jgi:hypothetical protein
MPAPSPGPSSDNVLDAITLQKAAVTRLKRDILGVDRHGRRRYIRDFHEEFSGYESVSSLDDLSVACYKADLVYIGDYHALPASQEFAARLIDDIAARTREVALCLEMIHARSQRAVDSFMEGASSEADFLREIRYDLDWGYDWPGFRHLFEVARAHRIPVFGIDCEPRSGFRFIHKRDAHAAAHIAGIARRRPEAKIVVVIGESHLGRRHLPGKVRDLMKREGLEKRSVVVVQNLEEIYWQLASRGLEQDSVVALGRDRYCVFNTSPLAKYEAYRQTLERWTAESDDTVDLAPTVYGMIDTILKFLGVDKYRARPAGRAGAGPAFLVDLYPEVHAGLDGSEARRLLREHKLSDEESGEVLAHIGDRGSCYVPRMNTIFIGQFNMVHAGEEAAHFVNLALKGEIFDAAPRLMAQHDLFYTGVLEEALGFFGSKLIDPSRNHFFETGFYQYYRKDRETVERETGYRFEDFNAIIDFILLHKRFEQTYEQYEDVPQEILDGIRAEPGRANILIHELGYFLGQQIYDAWRAGLFARADLRALFRMSFRDSGTALQTYLDLVEKVRPVAQGRPAGGTGR